MNSKVVIIYNFTLSGWMTPLLQAYLIYNGYRDTFLVRYRTDLSFNNAVKDISKQLETIINKYHDTIYVIGIFFGGLIANNLHRSGWNIRKAIYIGCPMQGNTTYQTIQDSNMLVRYTDSDPHEWLVSRNPEEIPPHEYHTISMGLLNTEFDGLLRKIDTVIDNENHSHVYWSSRWTPFLTYSLFNIIYNEMKHEDCVQLPNNTDTDILDDYIQLEHSEIYKDL